MPGPSKTPPHLKSIAGTIRADRDSDANAIQFATLDTLPEAPDWLPNGHAVKEWNRLGQVLVANKLLTEASLMAFAHLCALHGKVVQLWTAGETPTGHMLSQLRGLFDAFGVPPAAASKVRPAGKEGNKGNKFGRNGKRPA